MEKLTIEEVFGYEITSVTTRQVKKYFKNVIVDNLPLAKRFFIKRILLTTYAIYNAEREYIGRIQVK